MIGETLAAMEISKTNPEIFEMWNYLPPEIKSKCIESMNYKERTRLRQTSRIEKRLVDALRYEFDAVELTEMALFLYRKKSQENYFATIKLGHDLSGLIRAKNFDSSFDFYQTLGLVKNLWGKTEMISIDLGGEPISVDEFMGIPQIRKVTDLQLNWAKKEQVAPLIQKWLEVDNKVGSKLKIDCDHDCTDELAAKFEFQKSPQQSSTIRLQNGKHVLLEFKEFWRFEIYCTVISNLD